MRDYPLMKNKSTSCFNPAPDRQTLRTRFVVLVACTLRSTVNVTSVVPARMFAPAVKVVAKLFAQ